jgi:Fe-S oxidoreductase
MGGYLRDLRVLFERYGYRPSVYGHFGMGCVHCRIDFDLVSPPGVAKYRRFMEDATDLIVRYDGSFSGEHGDGQSRAEFLPKMFGPELVSAFGEFKSIWDPEGKMNPGKVVDPYKIDENLRLGPDYQPWDPKTHFHFKDDNGSFAHATSRCVGIGKCRRMNGEPGEDTMCPSFMVLREEKYTTRGRAHLLFEMLQKDSIQGGWRDEDVKDSLDLCLACKGCKTDCPANVDVATYKSEFLSHYYEGRVRPVSAYAFGFIDKWAQFASLAPGFVNLFTQLPVLRAVAKAAVGAPQERQIPAFAAQTFQTWFRRRGARNAGAEKVLLWPDTFNNYFFPETAQSAVEVLEHAGFSVEVPGGHFCCGRPLYDYGMLSQAKSYLGRTLKSLERTIEAKTPIVVLEPSCCSVFRDELPNLMPEHSDAERLSKQVVTLSEFLTSPRVRARGYTPPRFVRDAIAQGHCHHKSVIRFDAEEELFQQMGTNLDLLNSGCCGMAGSFGYEKGKKYEVSIAAGERVLLPKVRAAHSTTVIVADGFSCKEQIAQGTHRRPLHLAEVMKIAIDEGPDAKPTDFPERSLIEGRVAAQKRSMIRAGVVSVAVVGGLAVWTVARRRRRERSLRRLGGWLRQATALR